jgi:hypothetical protein
VVLFLRLYSVLDRVKIDLLSSSMPQHPGDQPVERFLGHAEVALDDPDLVYSVVSQIRSMLREQHGYAGDLSDMISR